MRMPAACSTLAAAIFTFLLLASASAMSRIEHRVIELLPPLGVGGLGHVLRLVPERLRGIDPWTFVVGADHAAGNTHDDYKKHQRSAHVSDLPLWQVPGSPGRHRREEPAGDGSGGDFAFFFLADRSARVSKR